MAYSIQNTSYLCRSEQAVRLYLHPNDIKPLSTVLAANTTFTTDGEITIGSITFLRIDLLNDTDDSMKGLWIPTDSLQMLPVEVEEEEVENATFDDSKAVSEYLLVRDENVVIYDENDSSTPIIGTFSAGDLITADRVINVTINGVEQTRYRIASVKGADGTEKIDMIGNWVLYDYRVKMSDENGEAKQEVVFVNRKLSTSKARYVSTDDDTTSSSDWDPVGDTVDSIVGSIKDFDIPTSADVSDYISENYVKQYSNISSLYDALNYYDPDAVNDGTYIRNFLSNLLNPTFTSSSTTKSSNAYATEASTASAGVSKTTVNTNRLSEAQVSAQVENANTMDEYYDQYGFSYGIESTTMSSPIGRLLFVHGMPFQYTCLTDRRAYSTNVYGMVSYPTSKAVASGGGGDFYGRTFAKEIAANMPICVVVPGVPKFLTLVKQGLLGGDASQNSDAVSDWVPLWSDLTDTESASILESLNQDADSDDVYQYYSMQIDTTGYYEYVNSLTQTAARLMGLSGVSYMGQDCTSFDWGQYNMAADQDYSTFAQVMGTDGGISFAFDPVSAISDSLTNSTGESQFASMLNGLSSKARELDFMGGSTGIDAIDELMGDTDYEAATAQANSGLFSGLLTPLSHITTFLKNAGHGMNVRFPQIWNDSSSTKSYSIDMKFLTPYATAFCKWRYVLVPFLSWFALAAPHSDNSLVNYSRPYLIRAFSKGYFNVEMGIVSSIQWKRFGDGDMISADGIPTEIDVTVDFEDLYQQLAMSKFTGDITASSKAVGIFFNNTGLMDLIGTLSGVNMNKISISDRMSLYTSAWAGALTDTGTNFMRSISDRVSNIAYDMLYGS